MADERRVVVRAQRREVLGDQEAGEILSYPGVGFVFYVGGRQVDESWVPVGDQPSTADDELLIEVLRSAVRWNETAGRPPRPGSRDAMTMRAP